MIRYKITLKPVDWFFFGGEQTFDNGKSQSYFATSNPFPQQTALLGMIRYQLLRSAGLLFSGDKEHDQSITPKANALVGEHSFDIDAKEPQSFGCIKAISPVFIQKGERRLAPMPLTHNIDISFSDGRVWLSGKQCGSIISAPAFKEKTYNNYNLFIDNTGKPWDQDDIFAASTQVGITKADASDKNEKGFFKQNILRFKDNDTCFAFYLDLDVDDETRLKPQQFVFLGAQQSCFYMECSICDEEPFVPDHPEGSILLCNHTYISDAESLNANCLQHWSGTISFRNLKNDNTGRLRSGAVAYRRHGSLCTFLTAGSVIFYSDEKQLKALTSLLTKPNLQNIGYNTFNIK